MKTNDLLKTAIQNLMRRKSRTLLTVLGVIIGCCSIIIMISIGIGMKESQAKMLAEMGDLTIIQVHAPNGGSSAPKLNSKSITSIAEIDNVEVATPKLTFDNLTIKLLAGQNDRYQASWSEVVGMYPEAIEKLGYTMLEGKFSDIKSGTVFPVISGENMAFSFADTKRPEGHNIIDLWSLDESEKKDPYFNVMNTPLKLAVEIDSNKGKAQSYQLNVIGRIKEDYNKGSETSQGLIMSVADMEKIISEYQRATGKKASAPKYSNAIIKVNDMKNVAEVEGKIKKLGFRTSSMESIREPMEKEARQRQMMLGGLGAISLFVAALGITNTMIMSISERTREIGVMKSLGCHIKSIRAIFLLEAGFIGMLGGIIGVLISLCISFIINIVSSPVPANSIMTIIGILTEPGNRISVVPIWLVAFAIVFSIIIGIGSGYYPANKAVRISALEAIKHD